MATVLIFHEVDDVDHWLGSPMREEFFGPLGMTARTFIDPTKTNRVGLVAEVPDLDTLQAALATEAAADAMKADGVRPETIVMLIES
jgi:3-oxoacyl-[acyl-carrier-protein] synthase III